MRSAANTPIHLPVGSSFATRDVALPQSLARGRAILFDLDGVLTRTADTHMRAWFQVLSPYLRQHHAASYTERDYFAYLDGKPRYDGVRAVLDSRGIRIPTGSPADPPDRETVCGLGNRKNLQFGAEIEARGVEAYPGSISFVHAAIKRGYRTAVVSSSANARQVLRAARIFNLFDAIIDGVDAESAGLAGKPSPDTYVAAASRLGLTAAECVVVEDAVVGVEAGRGGSFGLVVGVDRGAGADALRDHGADIVVDDLSLLITQLAHPERVTADRGRPACPKRTTV